MLHEVQPATAFPWGTEGVPYTTMETPSGDIRLAFTDPEINETLKTLPDRETPTTRRYTQGEDFFLQLQSPITIPHLPVHHDVRRDAPEASYLASLRDVTASIAEATPEILKNLTFLFDPGESLRPGFFYLYRLEERTYLYITRIDLHFRPQYHTVVERGTNDQTPIYRTNRLFLESDLIPLDQVVVEEGRVTAFRVNRIISQTWIGETGRGYLVQGVWLDRELTKFFSRLVLPKGARTYPFFPFTCKHKTVCTSLVDLDPGSRRRALPMLHAVRSFLAPRMRSIEAALRDSDFSEELAVFQEYKRDIPTDWEDRYRGLRAKAYLNDDEQKEYLLLDEARTQ
jgi:hypothetical protein